MPQKKALWSPSPERIDRANLTRFIRDLAAREPSVRDYPSLYDYSIREPGRFWQALWSFVGVRAQGDWEPALVDGDAMPAARFFPNVRLNFAQNLLRYRDDRCALIYADETGARIQRSYAQLHDDVARLAADLRALGIKPGDRVAALMPNRIETVVAMLAASAIGATFSSCSPDFGAAGIVDRFAQIAPRVLISVDGYPYGGKRHRIVDKLREVLARLPSVERLYLVGALDPHLVDVDLPQQKNYAELAAAAAPPALQFEPLDFNHPLYVLYSSGTTGVPKAIVHGAGGTLLQHLKELVLHADLKREDHILYYTTCGWMMWNWLVSSLAVGATVVLYEGSPFNPSPAALFDLIDELGLTVFGTSAKYLAEVQKSGLSPRLSHKLKSLKTLLSTGSPLMPEQFEWVYREIKAQVLLGSISGGTDIVSCFALANPLLPVYDGELQCRGLGMKVEILDDERRPLIGKPGELCCTAPFPSMPVGFWGDADGSRYRAAYFERFPGIWCHGDRAELTERGGIVIYGRSDAVLNPGGVRIGTAEIYRQVEKLDEIVEAICVGQEHDGDVRVVLFVRLRDGVDLDAALIERIRHVIRVNTTPRHVPARVIAVPAIPRTRSGKLVELAVRDVIHGRPVKNTEALANPEALAHFANRPELSS